MFKKIILFLLLSFCYTTYSQSEDISLISWNIQDFGKTKNTEELEQIAEIVKNTDIIAIQEVVAGFGGAQAVAKLTDILNRKGNQWDYVISNPTKSPKYVTERYAFIWKTKHIKIKNRGRLLKEVDAKIDREPFLLDFYIAKKKFSVLNYHSRPFNKHPETEIKALIEFIDSSLKTPLLLAGDFNTKNSHTVFESFKKQGFKTAITNQKTTLKKSCVSGNYLNHSIDTIFYSSKIIKKDSGVIDFVKFCDALEKARKLSDHLPVYLKFSVLN